MYKNTNDLESGIMHCGVRSVRLVRAGKPRGAFKYESLMQKNLRIGQEVLDDFRSKFGYPVSSSFLRQLKYTGNTARYSLLEKNIEKAIPHTTNQIDKLREVLNYDYNYEALCSNMSKFNSSNCGEQSQIIHYLLNKKKVSAAECVYFITNSNPKRPVKDHVFTVLGFNDREYLWNEPQYWGKFAVVVDAWANIAAPAEVWNKQILDFLKIEPYEQIKTAGMRVNPFGNYYILQEYAYYFKSK